MEEFICEKCGKKFDNNFSFQQHRRRCGIRKYSDQVENNEQEFKSCIKVKNDNGTYSYKCKICGKLFDSHIGASNHYRSCSKPIEEKPREFGTCIEIKNSDGTYSYKCKYCDRVYNSPRGASNHSRFCINLIGEDEYEKRCDKYRGENNPMYGKSNSHPGLSGEENPMYGKHHTLETRAKMSRNHADFKGRNHPQYGKPSSLKGKSRPQFVIDKVKKTCMEKYGSNSPLGSDLVKDKIKQSCMEKYGVPYPCMTEQCISSNSHIISKSNKNFKNYLKNDFNIDSEFEFHIGHYSYDLHILNSNILIEINPGYTHNSTIGPKFANGRYRDPRSSNYHLNKTELAIQSGYHCIHVFDWDSWTKIINIINPNKTKIYARNCEIKEVPVKECNEFLNEYHLQGTCRNQNVRLGLYHNDELIQLMTFGKPRYNKNYQWELLRFCSHKNYSITGGSQKLFKYFIKNYNPESIISYCDRAKFTGNVYNKLGFILKNQTGPAINWSKGFDRITDNLLRQRGADQLIGTNDGKGTSNRKIMIREGWVEVYDCGQNVYIWEEGEE